MCYFVDLKALGRRAAFLIQNDKGVSLKSILESPLYLKQTLHGVVPLTYILKVLYHVKIDNIPGDLNQNWDPDSLFRKKKPGERYVKEALP